MTTVDTTPHRPAVTDAAPPFSRALRIVAGLCLVAAGLLNGLPQFLVTLVSGDLSFSEQIAWGAEHPMVHGLEQTALVVSSLVMLIGLLGVAQVCRFRAPGPHRDRDPPRGLGDVGLRQRPGHGLRVRDRGAGVLSVDRAVALNDGLSSHPGVVAVALVPHLIGSFLGLVLLSAAIWRSRAFPRATAVLLVAFLVWDFGLPPLGPVDAHVLLVVAWVWMGVHLLRMPDAVWRGATPGTA